MELFPGTSWQQVQSNKNSLLLRSVTTIWFTNIYVIPIDYAFRPRLRVRLTLRRLTLRRNPWSFGDGVSHTVFRYSCLHSHFRYLQRLSRVLLHWLTERSATTCHKTSPKLRHIVLAPVHLRRRYPRPVSCYAFFKGWLLLSQPPGCYRTSTSFPT
jgi:hypothetical protein